MVILALILAVANERLRRTGDVLFQEIGDELQWNTRAEKVPPGKGAANERPPLEARVILRRFAQGTDLPLVPGRFGPAVYAAFNILMGFVLIWYYHRTIRPF